MSNLMLRARVFVAGTLLVLWAALTVADEITITRIGSCDWICTDADFVQLSCHQRLDKAVEACANRALASGQDHHISGAQYRVGATRNAVPQTASITLSWIAPTQNEDGTPLTDLAGFRLYYGVGPGDYSRVIDIADPSRLSYVIEGLEPGVWHFVATAYNSVGTESTYSNATTFEVF